MHRILIILIALSTLLPAQAQTGPVDLRGDEGLLMDLKPTGAVWLGPDRVMVCDRRFNDFHIFDLTGRRYKFLSYPIRSIPIAQFACLTPLDETSFLTAGSHHHEKNHVRYVSARSVVFRIGLEGEELARWCGEVNLEPDRALRATGNFGESPRTPLELQGLAVDTKNKRIFFGCSQPMSSQESILVYEGKLDKFLARDKGFELKELKTDLKPETDPTTNTPYFLADMQYIPGEGLLLLLGSQSYDKRTFGASQLWMLRGGFPPPKLVMKDIAPGNRAAGLAVRHIKERNYDVAITFDNDPEETRIPSRLLVLPGVKL